MVGKGVRVGAAAFFVGLSLAGPVPLALAEGGEQAQSSAESPAASSSAGVTRSERSPAQRPPRQAARSEAAPELPTRIAQRAQLGEKEAPSAASKEADVAAAPRSALLRVPTGPKVRTVRIPAGPQLRAVSVNPAAAETAAGIAAIRSASAAAEVSAVEAVPRPAGGTLGWVRSVAAVKTVGTVGSSINSLVSGVFDALTNWLSSLPPSPVSHVAEGALLLVRRGLFNQAPTAVPVQWAQTATNIVGTVGATDFEGDQIVYTVVTRPQYGDVTIDPATGAYTYTPPAFDSVGGTDEFTVRLTDAGFHLNLLGPTSTVVTVPVTISGVDLLQSFTRGFDIYNWTSKTLKYLRYEQSAPDSGPGFNTEFKPGETAHFEVTFYAFQNNISRVVFGATDSTESAPNFWAVDMKVSSFDGASSTQSCFASGGNKCKDYPYTTYWAGGYEFKQIGEPKAAFLDPPDTVIAVSGDARQKQSDLLNALCKGTASCGPFEVKDTTPLNPDWTTQKQVGSGSFNNSDAISSKAFTYSFTQSEAISVAVEAFVGAKIGSAVKAGLFLKTAKIWTTSATFSETLTQNLLPYSYGVISAAPYLTNVRGDYTVKLGNTTWNLKDVVFTLPSQDKCADAVCKGAVQFYQQPLQEGFGIKDPKADTPYNPVYSVGDRKQLLVTAYNGVGSSPDYTTRVTYTSSNPDVATVLPTTGVVTAIAPGTTQITATYIWKIDNEGRTLVTSLPVTVISPKV